ncbi:MAG: DUF2064 domain-containing protein [Elusimicrobia bacterium]|nr:DUF2064 domain-containing protein [Elusimicrobiota bacterium]
MSQKRDNCIILLVDPPEADRIGAEFKTAFGPERATHVNNDLLAAAYKLAKNFDGAMLLLSYIKTPRHPDLTWLDPEDPGFLEVKNPASEDRIQDAFRLAFFTGARKAVLVRHLSPELKSDWLALAFEAVSDKTAAIGANQDGSFYLLGLTQQNLKILEAPGFFQGKSAESLAERAKKNKLTVFSTPETYALTSEETLQKWMEEKETLPPLFPHPKEAAHQENRKNHRHHAHHQEAQVQPAPEKPPL